MTSLTTPDVAELLAVAEAATLCGCSTPTIRRRIREGELPAVQLGGPGKGLRVPRAGLQAWLWAGPHERGD
jgi:excisionase family DNA binding protein